MGLDSAIFILFLCCVSAAHAVLPPRGRVALLVCASLAFYAASNINYLVLLLILCGLNYAAVLSLSHNSGERRRKGIFIAAVALNLTVLILFKYETKLIASALRCLGWSSPVEGGLARIAAPLGLSYFTFQMLACITDTYRGTWKLEGGLSRFVLFGFFFPQISSGPIPRADRLFPQLLGGNTTAEDRLIGLRLITYGLFKKFVVANRLSEYVNAVFDEKQGVSTFAALIACCFNALQLYADFSGYVDIAIGSARFLGIRLDPNFDRPFVSTSVTEFWRRWHITLAVWLRDYLYMPLLIRIRDLGKTGIVVAMMVTFAICGIWHGATWTFLLFGVAQGVAMSTEMLTKSWRTKRLKQYPKQWVTRVGLLYTLSFFALSQVMFRSADLSQAQQFYRNLFSLRLPHSAAELSAYGGPFFFILDFVVIGLWVAIASYLPKVSNSSTPPFMFVCALLILFFGRLGSAHFIYAAF